MTWLAFRGVPSPEEIAPGIWAVPDAYRDEMERRKRDVDAVAYWWPWSESWMTEIPWLRETQWEGLQRLMNSASVRLARATLRLQTQTLASKQAGGAPIRSVCPPEVRHGAQ